MYWQTSRRQISLDHPLVMGILNVTPDSFSDGGEFLSVDAALARAEQMIADGVDIIDIGGESTRPGSKQVDPEIEIQRTLPIAEQITKRFDIPVSIDTSKSPVAKALIDHGAEIINDISGLRWDAQIADVAARSNAGLVLMHSLGAFETMHREPPVADIYSEVCDGLKNSLALAKGRGVNDAQIVLDVGIGFGTRAEQNLELLAKLGNIVNEFADYPMLVGASRKSFIGKVLGDVPVEKRLYGSLASAAVAVWNGAKIVRVHDIRETVETLKIVQGIKIHSQTEA